MGQMAHTGHQLHDSLLELHESLVCDGDTLLPIQSSVAKVALDLSSETGAARAATRTSQLFEATSLTGVCGALRSLFLILPLVDSSRQVATIYTIKTVAAPRR
jgi:hypothetical protein